MLEQSEQIPVAKMLHFKKDITARRTGDDSMERTLGVAMGCAVETLLP
jgi:hypothetical protein